MPDAFQHATMSEWICFVFVVGVMVCGAIAAWRSKDGS